MILDIRTFIIMDMTVETFFKNYDLTQMDVVSIRNTPDGIAFVVDMDFNMHFDGGNHVRTEFDMTFCHEFVFSGTHSKRDYLNQVLSQQYKDRILHLGIDGDDLWIQECNIVIHKNVSPYIDHTIQ